MDCTVWNERHRTRLACRRPGAGAHRDIERGKVPSAARVACIARSACTSLDQNSNEAESKQWIVVSGTNTIGHGLHVADRVQGLTGTLLHDVIWWVNSWISVELQLCLCRC